MILPVGSKVRFGLMYRCRWVRREAFKANHLLRFKTRLFCPGKLSWFFKRSALMI